MNNILGALIMSSMTIASTAIAQPSFNQVVADDALTRMFTWWNKAYEDPQGFTAEAFARHFTDDAVMRINGSVRGTGPAELAAHFRRIQDKTDKVRIELPFLQAFSSPDGSKIFTYHHVSAASGGKLSQEMVMGYAELRDGKIARIEFLGVVPAE